jgi:hypothetical protein
MMDDPKASAQLAHLMHDSDVNVAQIAINSSYNGGRDVDQALAAIVNDGGADPQLRASAANQLRTRGTDLDANTDKAVTELAGPAQQYGGYGYGGMEEPMLE